MMIAPKLRMTMLALLTPLLAGFDDAPPVVEPVRPARIEQVPTRAGEPAPRVDLDPAVLGPAPGQAPPPLRREGEFIVQRPGRVVYLDAHGGHWVFQPLADDEREDLPAMVLQRSARLQTIVSYIRQARDADDAEAVDEGWFVLSGRVHTYRGVNYLLVTAMRPHLARERDAADAEPDPQTDAEADEPAPEAEQADEIERLMQQLLERRAAPPVPMAPGVRDAAEPGETVLRDEGELVVQRRGRLARTGDGAEALFVFEADERDSPEPPMRLMPSQLLASMENTAARRGGSSVFVVSGVVYSYQGQNHLLPTATRLARPHRNLQ